MAKKEKDISVLKSEHLDVKDLMVPRIEDDVVKDPENVYLHWTALVLLFRDVFPEGAIKTYVVSDDGIYLTMGCKLYSKITDEKPITECSYRAMYDDDVCDTYTSCQSMALRTALIITGIGTDEILKDERKRRLDKIVGKDDLPETNDGSMTSGELFNALANKSKSKKEQTKEVPEEGEKDTEESITPAQTSEAPTEEKPKKRRGRPPKAKKDEEKSEEPVKEKTEEPVQEEIATVTPTKKAEEVTIDENYVASEDDFKLSRYAKLYAGTAVKDLPEPVLEVALMSDDIVSDRLRSAVEAYKK